MIGAARRWADYSSAGRLPIPVADMDARLIRFPRGASHAPAASGGAVARSIDAPVGVGVAELAIGFRPLLDLAATNVGMGMALAVASAGLSADRVWLEGTNGYPVVLTRWSGVDAAERAAAAALEADEVVRERSGEVVIAAAIALGHEVEVAEGIIRRVGLTDARHLAELAAPGQVLLAGAAWERASRVSSVPAGGGGRGLFVLRGLR